MKTLTFDIICSLLFGLERGPRRTDMINGFREMMEGMWSIPINLPFTKFNRSLRASSRVHTKVRELVHEKRVALESGHASPHQDLITCMLSNEGIITQGEIEDNAITVMIAGHDTSAVVITFFMRLLANDPIVYANVVHGKVHPVTLGSSLGDGTQKLGRRKIVNGTSIIRKGP